jgi:hypothetical protein
MSESELTLCEASSLSGLKIHDLKEAIREGRLAATWKGKYLIKRADLIKFVRGKVPYRVVYELERFRQRSHQWEMQ